MRPLVSCVMPTCNRRHFIARSIQCFLEQDWMNRELVVLDDGADKVADLFPDSLMDCHYFPVSARMTYGAKLNECIRLAHGEFILHWDDDDVFARDRITRQVTPLIVNPEMLVSGTSTLYYHRHGTREAFQFAGSKQSWLGGICYRKSSWQSRPFDEEKEPGADCRWLRDVPNDKRFDVADPSLIVGTIHGGNHSPKHPVGIQWRKLDWGDIAPLIGT